jgi:hypothetical protein
MKWFKHISDSLDDPFIADLINEFHGDGYLAFFGILEMMSREFDVETPGKVSLSYKYIQHKLRIRRNKLNRILEFCQRNERILYESNGKYVYLNCPKLKEMCDEFTQKLLKSKIGSESGLNQESVGSESGTEVRSKKKEVRNKNIKEKNILTDDKFLQSLKEKFTWVDFDKEMVKIDAWLMANPGRQKTRRFMVKWISKVEKPIEIQKSIKPLEPVKYLDRDGTVGEWNAKQPR